ncbi:large ribosomal subunit protein mL51 [Hyperolius riggenbachi]|uniref:large ribosomal subunit protein mL51 n=1 Tax=Hyperolius riggenbachi TaxID=752182 RepID=UPI0035A27796
MWAVTPLLVASQSVGPCLVQASRSFSLGCCNMVRNFMPQPKIVDRWNEKRALFGVYDNIGILGDFKAHPKELIIGPSWLRGYKGNELQRCLRKKMMVGSRMFYEDRLKLEKRIRYLYKRFNRYGKHR